MKADKHAQAEHADRMRLDKWLWAARFYKTRSLAADDIDKGRIRVNELVAKPSRDLKMGDQVDIRQGPLTRTFTVQALSTARGPAPQAQLLYQETPQSILLRAEFAARRKVSIEPADAIEQGRPTKRDRRLLADWQSQSGRHDE